MLRSATAGERWRRFRTGAPSIRAIAARECSHLHLPAEVGKAKQKCGRFSTAVRNLGHFDKTAGRPLAGSRATLWLAASFRPARSAKIIRDF
jgi:hypothetical protein